MNIRYGKKEERTSLDDNGSEKIVTTVYRDNVPHTQVRYEVRVRVKDQTEEMAEYYRFRLENKRNSSFVIQNNKNDSDYYYVIKCWEE